MLTRSCPNPYLTCMRDLLTLQDRSIHIHAILKVSIFIYFSKGQGRQTRYYATPQSCRVAAVPSFLAFLHASLAPIPRVSDPPVLGDDPQRRGMTAESWDGVVTAALEPQLSCTWAWKSYTDVWAVSGQEFSTDQEMPPAW
jgi:hypothetical protein